MKERYTTPEMEVMEFGDTNILTESVVELASPKTFEGGQPLEPQDLSIFN